MMSEAAEAEMRRVSRLTGPSMPPAMLRQVATKVAGEAGPHGQRQKSEAAMAQTGRIVPRGTARGGAAADGTVWADWIAGLTPTDAAAPGADGLPGGMPEGLVAIDHALANGLAIVAQALAALDRAAGLLDDQRWLLESLADQRATAEERIAAMRGFGTARLRLRGVCDGITLLDGTAPRGLRVITGLDGGAISVAAHDIRPRLAAIAEAPSARLAAAMLMAGGPLAEARRAVQSAQARLAADQRRLRNRQSLNAALALAAGDAAAPPRHGQNDNQGQSLMRRLAGLFRPRGPGR